VILNEFIPLNRQQVENFEDSHASRIGVCCKKNYAFLRVFFNIFLFTLKNKCILLEPKLTAIDYRKRLSLNVMYFNMEMAYLFFGEMKI